MVRQAKVLRTAVWLVTTVPSYQFCCRVVRLCVITKMCELIAYLLARAYDAFKEWWYLLYRSIQRPIVHYFDALCISMYWFLYKCYCIIFFLYISHIWWQHLWGVLKNKVCVKWEKDICFDFNCNGLCCEYHALNTYHNFRGSKTYHF